MAKKVLNTGMQGIGPYNAAVWAGDLLFVSGQIPYNPEEDKLITGNIELETKQVMENVAAILLLAGLTWNDVVKATIYLEDMNQFNIVNEIYKTYFDLEFAPARECVEVSSLPKNVGIEISVIATK